MYTHKRKTKSSEEEVRTKEDPKETVAREESTQHNCLDIDNPTTFIYIMFFTCILLFWLLARIWKD